MALNEEKQSALIPFAGARPNGHGANGETGANGNGHKQTALVVAPAKPDVQTNGNGHLLAPGDAPATQEAPELERIGWRGWWRTLQVVRVMWLLSFYLFLENYEARSKFNQRMAARAREEAQTFDRRARFRAWRHDVTVRILDRLIRAVRFIVFRGADDSQSKAARLERQGAWFKRSLIKLGPTFIKIGQALGTRGDLLPLAYVKELATLQDQVPPYPTTEAYARIEAELGRTLQAAFAEIDAEPIAAASLGQVYRARLHNGAEVAVKVQRPNLEAQIGFDIAILRRLVKFLSRFPSFTENADWDGMLREFAETIREEMDYVNEGHNADRFRASFKDWRPIRVPHIYWSHTTRHVLTLEFIRGTKVTDLEGLKARRISPVKVNRLLVRTYLKQLLEDGFFHADPHPGNLLVMDTGHLAFFDFGMTGRITPRLQAQMIDAFFHVVERDVSGLAQDLINLDFLKPGVNPELVRPVVEGLFKHYLNLKLGEVNFKELTYELAEVMYEYPFRLPARFTYIMRALMTLEGIGIITDPEFSFFDTAKPFAKEFMLRREGKQFRRLVMDKLAGRDENGRIDWRKMWKLAKMAAKMYLEK
jgi:predicted unusual protein kinase regulating ubiquinone biosynthesis (AarF/ABC1/UbiB family)